MLPAANAPVRDWATFQPALTAGATLMNAHFLRHTFERHSHETYSIGMTRTGVQTFNCGGSRHASLPGDLILFNPDVPHDGQPGAPDGFGYTMLYLPVATVKEWVDREAGLLAPLYFRSPVVRDMQLAHCFSRAAEAVAQTGEALRAEELLAMVTVTLLARYGEPGSGSALASALSEVRMGRVREYLHARFNENVTVQDLARVAELSRVHVTRAFTRAYGVPPHLYLNTLRLRHARGAMMQGMPLSEVASACGFADRSHFNRRFKGAMGISPASWLLQVRIAKSS
jgi:AraC-like DNA-binding protein